MQLNLEILSPETSYHVYNRANGSERLFRSVENYRYFLKKYEEYISPLADTFCYCLMPNHFHFLIRIKPEKELLQNLTRFETLSGFAKEKALANRLSQQFSHLFNAYTQALNKQIGRKGGLFMRPFKRKKINDTAYLIKLVHYIHLNPIEAGLCGKPGNWLHSSYSDILSEKPSFLQREELLSWFGDKENFIHFHSQQPEDIEV